jgi:hypothetical protein
MKWTLCLVTAAAAGCQESKQQQPIPDPQGTSVISLPKAAVTDAYMADITTLCDCVKLSGADQKPKDERWPVIAMWLGPNIKTSEGHEFLVAIQPLKGEAKALALETESRRIGLTGCALAT